MAALSSLAAVLGDEGGDARRGIAFSALFGIAAALTIAWTVFMATLGDDPALQSRVVDA
ncbi:hypothetical protein [Mobilicoccus pelagius]|uniref:Putative ribonuclease BN n=1 Tax=Mobilicoccus pelagius NBRC 104925 TaxID=1089455 RepID=H5URZ9_9MICO|nr:hypothetical protein [Mobilicoccus pelagius]GAB48507.1 putative ribonuclease BN [Mobilicoccus pelagius NBRC 104925]